MHDQNELSSTKPFTRRSVVRTAAWAVPAVSLTAASPAFAVSPISGPIGSPNGLGVNLGNDTSTLLRLQTSLSNSAPLAATLLPNGPNVFTITNTSAGNVSGVGATITVTYDSSVVALGSSPGIEIQAVTRSGGSPAAIDRAAPTPHNKAINVAFLDMDVEYLKTYTTAATVSLPSIPPGTTTFELSYALTGLPSAPALPGTAGLTALLLALGVSGTLGVGVIPRYRIDLTLTHSALTGAAPTSSAHITSLVDLAAGVL